MFFITNSEDCVIGADEEFMNRMGATNLVETIELKKKMTLDAENSHFKSDELNAKYTQTTIICPLGKVGLYQLEELKEDIFTQPIEDLSLEVDSVEEETSIFTSDEPKTNNDTSIFSLEDTEPVAKPTPPQNESHMLEDLEKELLASMDNDEPFALDTQTDKPDTKPDIQEDEPLILFADEPIIEKSNTSTQEENDTAVIDNIFNEPEDELFSIVEDSKPTDILTSSTEEISMDTPVLEEEPEEELFSIMSDSAPISNEPPKPKAIVEDTPPISMDEPLFDLGLDTTPTEPEAIIADEVSHAITIEEPTTIESTKVDTIDEEVPTIDINSLAASIGVDVEQYKMFLGDFISEAKDFESDLRGMDKSKSDDAVAVIEEASMLLGITTISEKINKYKIATLDMKEQAINELMNALNFIENPNAEPIKPQDNPVAEQKIPEVDTSISFLDDDEDLLSLDNDDFFKDTEPQKPKEEPRTSSPEDALAEFLKQSANEEVKVEEKEKPIPDIIDILDVDMNSSDDSPLESPKEIKPVIPTQNSREDAPMELITLESVSPIPFDFSINQAADELTLPADLVAEFVGDFIDQAKENLPILQEEYNKRDLDGIEKTAHLLKGASSNLRIVHMAETLEKLQLNTEFRLVPDLIRTFAGQLKALDAQMGI